MANYIFGTNINNSGEEGIVDIDNREILCICPKENAERIIEALKYYDLIHSLERDKAWEHLLDIQNKRNTDK